MLIRFQFFYILLKLFITSIVSIHLIKAFLRLKQCNFQKRKLFKTCCCQHERNNIARCNDIIDGWSLLYDERYSFICSRLSREPSDFHSLVTYTTNLYFFSKILDLVDTVFMVLKKNFHQISFLHVYHHTLMSFSGFAAVRYFPNTHFLFLGLVNCTVHMIMYFYYMITTISPKYKNNLWWKKYITQVQMVQHIMVAVHHLVTLFNLNCSFPRVILVVLFFQAIHMFYMFYGFYYNAYINPKNQKKPLDKKG